MSRGLLMSYRTFGRDDFSARFVPSEAMKSRGWHDDAGNGRDFRLDLWTPDFRIDGEVHLETARPLDRSLDDALFVDARDLSAVVTCEGGVAGAKLRALVGRAPVASGKTICSVSVPEDSLVPGRQVLLRVAVVLDRDLAPDGRAGARESGSVLWEDSQPIVVDFPRGGTFWKPEILNFDRFSEEVRQAPVHIVFSSEDLEDDAFQAIRTYVNNASRTFAAFEQATAAWDRRQHSGEQEAMVLRYQIDLLTLLAVKVLSTPEWVRDLSDPGLGFDPGTLGHFLRRNMLKLFGASPLDQVAGDFERDPQEVITCVASAVLTSVAPNG